MSRVTGAFLLGFVFIITTSCAKKVEADDLAKAQECLDQVPVGQPGRADACLPLVKDYTSQQAMILKCSIIMTSGGLMEDKEVKAFNALKDDTQVNKTAVFMSMLSLDYPDINTAYTKALQADAFCQATGVVGFKYLSGVIVAGTYMNKVIASLSGTPIDINNPTAITNAVTDLLNQCGGVLVPPASCTADLPALGAVVQNLAGSYCTTAEADPNVCIQINNAVDASGGSSTNVGQSLFCYLNHKTYNAATGLCQ